jgi:phenylacetate-CoA ligase
MRPVEAALCARDLLWLARSRRWDAEQIAQYQRRMLEGILVHAATTVPYYRALGIDRQNLSLDSFPLLTKHDVQTQGESLLSDAFDPRHLHVSLSSGSTGRPTHTWYDRNAWVLAKHAMKLRRVLTDLRGPPYRLLIIGEESPTARRSSGRSLAGTCRLSIHDGIQKQLEVISRFRPTGIYGSPSWLLELVQTAKREQIALPRVRVVWTSSEVLTASVREELARGFGGAVRDIYGSTEFKEVAVECTHGRRHINFESSHVEVLPETASGAGSIVITSLINRAMPLIRYRVGDIGRLGTTACACGRAAAWLDELGGREVDLIEVPGGHRVSPYLLSTVIEAHGAIARYQLFEQEAGRIDVRFQLRPDVDTFDAAPLAQELDRAVNGALRFSFSRTDDIERTPAGKHRPLIRSATSS